MADIDWITSGVIDRQRERLIALFCDRYADINKPTVRSITQFVATDLLVLLNEVRDMLARGDFDANDHQRERMRLWREAVDAL